ncbi:nucleoside transporter C-terminal domain-containing protein, partial [Mycolicibacterium goodii]
WFGQDNWSLEGLFGVIFSPLAWAIGVPWEEAGLVGNFIGQKTILNEFVGYTAFSEHVDTLSDKSIMLASFALAGFANLSSIAIQIGSFGALCPERRSEVASLGMKALFAGFCTNMLNAAIVGVVAF